MTRIVFDSKRKDSYDIIIEPGILTRLGEYLRNLGLNSEHTIVITDRNVGVLYADLLAQSLQKENFKSTVIAVEAGEQSKTLAKASGLWKQLAKLEVRRRDIIIALGGGVITDLAGFAAAGYMRGIPYLNIPTSLLAQVDAAIGSKVAVDHEAAKNLIGFFYHPLAVYIDPNVLRTLPEAEIRHGLAEVIKVAIIQSPYLFEFLEHHASALLNFDIKLLSQVIELAVNAKIQLVTPDLYERNLQRALNFGHTFGHALETALSYENISHGEAIAIGMAAATRIANARGLLDDRTTMKIIDLIARFKLPVFASGISTGRLWKALSIIRSIRNGYFHVVLPNAIGGYIFYENLSAKDVEQYMCKNKGIT
jgi:3-dehydroquinate synthase